MTENDTQEPKPKSLLELFKEGGSYYMVPAETGLEDLDTHWIQTDSVVALDELE